LQFIFYGMVRFEETKKHCYLSEDSTINCFPSTYKQSRVKVLVT
jgi:hypothetical protein